MLIAYLILGIIALSIILLALPSLIEKAKNKRP